jgi:hypothetical protein
LGTPLSDQIDLLFCFISDRGALGRRDVRPVNRNV